MANNEKSEEQKKKEEMRKLVMKKMTIIRDMEHLQTLLESNKKFPDKKQDMQSLEYLHEKIQECLNLWYY